MHPFEGMFRRRFRKTPDGYVFRQWGQDAVFTPDEYEEFIRLWRRIWCNPLIWVGYVLAGVVAPLWIWQIGNGDTALVLAITSAIILAVLLVHIERKPNEAAQMRVVAPMLTPEPRRFPWYAVPLFLIACSTGFNHFRRHDWGEFRFWLAVAGAYALALGISVWRSWRRRNVASDR